MCFWSIGNDSNQIYPFGAMVSTIIIIANDKLQSFCIFCDSIPKESMATIYNQINLQVAHETMNINALFRLQIECVERLVYVFPLCKGFIFMFRLLFLELICLCNINGGFCCEYIYSKFGLWNGFTRGVWWHMGMTMNQLIIQLIAPYYFILIENEIICMHGVIRRLINHVQTNWNFAMAHNNRSWCYCGHGVFLLWISCCCRWFKFT